MIRIDESLCIRCGACVRDCSMKNIRLGEKSAECLNGACNRCGHCLAVCPVGAVSLPEYGSSQVVEYDPDEESISEDRFLDFLRARRSIRQFKDRKVEKEKLEKLLQAGRYAPSSGNRQSVSYLIIQEGLDEFRDTAWEVLEDMAQRAFSGEQFTPQQELYAPMWHRGYEDFCRDRSRDVLFFNAPVLLVVRSDNVVDAAIAADHIQFMAEAMGLGTLYSGFLKREIDNYDSIRKILCTEQHPQAVCMLIGYPDVKYYRTVPRKELSVEWR